jgi:hypothetical protein
MRKGRTEARGVSAVSAAGELNLAHQKRLAWVICGTEVCRAEREKAYKIL